MCGLGGVIVGSFQNTGFPVSLKVCIGEAEPLRACLNHRPPRPGHYWEETRELISEKICLSQEQNTLQVHFKYS